MHVADDCLQEIILDPRRMFALYTSHLQGVFGFHLEILILAKHIIFGVVNRVSKNRASRMLARIQFSRVRNAPAIGHRQYVSI